MQETIPPPFPSREEIGKGELLCHFIYYPQYPPSLQSLRAPGGGSRGRRQIAGGWLRLSASWAAT